MNRTVHECNLLADITLAVALYLSYHYLHVRTWPALHYCTELALTDICNGADYAAAATISPAPATGKSSYNW